MGTNQFGAKTLILSEDPFVPNAWPSYDMNYGFNSIAHFAVERYIHRVELGDTTAFEIKPFACGSSSTGGTGGGSLAQGLTHIPMLNRLPAAIDWYLFLA